MPSDEGPSFSIPRSGLLVAGLVVTLVLLGLGTYWLTSSPQTTRLQTGLSVAEAMSSDTTGYRRATAPRPFSFPADHGPHPGYKTEWWYLTGNLDGPEGGAFGYELTIFRFAVAPPAPSTPASQSDSLLSNWRTNQTYMAHFAVSDGRRERFHAEERFARGGAGLAGARAEPFRVWLEDWSMSSTGSDTFPVRLQAYTDEARIDLTVRPEKPLVLQGNQGLSQKGPGAGNASYYYSFTRLATEGTLVIDGDSLPVSGTSWMDREWSTSALGPNQEGWDWFALQLDDGRDVMYYQLRNDDGTTSRFSKGTLVQPDGTAQRLSQGEVSLDVLDTWTTPDGTHTYPIEWQLEIPSENIDLHVVPLFRNQELDVFVRYWEGAVRVGGSATGRGYVELTGYGESDTPAS